MDWSESLIALAHNKRAVRVEIKENFPLSRESCRMKTLIKVNDSKIQLMQIHVRYI